MYRTGRRGRRLGAGWQLLFCLLWSGVLYAQDQALKKSADYVVAPLKMGSQNQLVVRTQINGKPAAFVVDTGAPISCMSEDRAAYYGLKPFSGSRKMPATVMANGRVHRVGLVGSWRLGAVELRDTPVILININEVERHNDSSGDTPVEGIIGLDILCGLGALIDYSGGDLYLKSSLEKNPEMKAAFDRAMIRGGWTSVPMQTNKGHFVVESAVEGKRALFVVDTGAPVSVVDREFCRRANLAMTNKTLSAKGLNFSDQSSGVTKEAQLQIGDVPAGKWPLVVFDLTRLLRTARNPRVLESGLLGSHTLLANAAVIDCENLRLYVRGSKTE